MLNVCGRTIWCFPRAKVGAAERIDQLRATHEANDSMNAAMHARSVREANHQHEGTATGDVAVTKIGLGAKASTILEHISKKMKQVQETHDKAKDKLQKLVDSVDNVNPNEKSAKEVRDLGRASRCRALRS